MCATEQSVCVRGQSYMCVLGSRGVIHVCVRGHTCVYSQELGSSHTCVC